MVNRHNVRIWGSEHQHVVWINGGWSHWTIFFFAEETITGITYLDMLESFVFPQVNHRHSNLFFSVGWSTSTLASGSLEHTEWGIPTKIDWERWSNSLATLVAWHYSLGFLPVGVC
jgi:hypothetical protein